jgi:hypothetical protein
VYLLGARPGVADQVRLWVESHYPNVKVVGVRDGGPVSAIDGGERGLRVAISNESLDDLAERLAPQARAVFDAQVEA